MREYDETTLKKLQQYELGILRDFIKVCEENGLSYFGFAGTGIGALRHGGFIPWDDDIDVAIPREDLNKLIEIFNRDFSDKYVIVNAECCKDYPMMTTHIILKDSLFVTKDVKNLKYPKGIFLDVFPLDHAADDQNALKKQAYITWLWGKILVLKHVPFPTVPFFGFAAKLAHVATAVAWFLLNLFCISHKFLYNRMMKASTKYNCSNTESLGFFCNTTPFDFYYKKNEIFPLRKLLFEDMEICFPNALEAKLTNMYGDYMQLPPPEKRKNHFPYMLQFPGEAEIRRDA